jgi:hypothetical protein
VCEPIGSLGIATSPDWPAAPSPLVGSDIRFGRHDCYERMVIEYTGSGPLPAWAVGYGKAILGESDMPDPELEGTTTLVVSAQAWMGDLEGRGYQGPSHVEVGFTAIERAKLIENWEGVMRWAIVVDRVRPFRVTVLDSPPRLVVDVSVPTRSPVFDTLVPRPTPDEAIAAFLAPGTAYVAGCENATQQDIGAYCATLFDDRGTTRTYLLGMAFSETSTFLRLDRVAGGWLVTDAAPLDLNIGTVVPW